MLIAGAKTYPSVSQLWCIHFLYFKRIQILPSSTKSLSSSASSMVSSASNKPKLWHLRATNRVSFTALMPPLSGLFLMYRLRASCPSHWMVFLVSRQCTASHSSRIWTVKRGIALLRGSAAVSCSPLSNVTPSAAWSSATNHTHRFRATPRRWHFLQTTDLHKTDVWTSPSPSKLRH